MELKIQRKQKKNINFEKLKSTYSYLDFSKFKYINSKEKSIIVCPEHGDFEINAEQIKRGNICPKCKKQYGTTGHCSNGEIKIINYLNSKNIIFEREVGFYECRDGNPLSFDFYIKDKNLLIEYNGAQHYKFIPFFHKTIKSFRKQKHHDWLKRNYAKRNNINLLTISYKEDIIEALSNYFEGYKE